MEYPSNNNSASAVPAASTTANTTSMDSVTTNSNPPPAGTSNTANTTTVKAGPSAQTKPDPELPVEVPREISDAEMQLVSSLAKLQKLESMIHQLRTLLPDRVLDPLVPIVNPSAAGGRAPPKSPAALYQQLAAAMSSAVAEVNEFQGLWRSADMRTMWERLGAQIDANGGQLLQPTGVWDRDYEALRADLAARETEKMERERHAEEDAERARIQAAEGGWRGVVEGFVTRNGGSVRVIPSKKEDEMTVVLGKAGMRFRVYADGAGASVDGGAGVPEWRVSARPVPGQPVSRAETAVVECLNARGRQWDLVYLLNMISAYSDIKQTPCVKCSRMTDNAANLPTIRRQTPAQAEGQPPAWEALHPICV
ncbi:mediator complex subunit 27-domain-containing protein [Aspergillus floccosus]